MSWTADAAKWMARKASLALSVVDGLRDIPFGEERDTRMILNEGSMIYGLGISPHEIRDAARETEVLHAAYCMVRPYIKWRTWCTRVGGKSLLR